MPPRSYKLGTRYLSDLLANTTEGIFILSQLSIERIIKFICQHANTTIDIFLAMFFILLQLEQLVGQVQSRHDRNAFKSHESARSAYSTHPLVQEHGRFP